LSFKIFLLKLKFKQVNMPKEITAKVVTKDNKRYVKVGKKFYRITDPHISNKQALNVVIKNIINNNENVKQIRRRRKKTSKKKQTFDLKDFTTKPDTLFSAGYNVNKKTNPKLIVQQTLLDQTPPQQALPPVPQQALPQAPVQLQIQAPPKAEPDLLQTINFLVDMRKKVQDDLIEQMAKEADKNIASAPIVHTTPIVEQMESSTQTIPPSSPLKKTPSPQKPPPKKQQAPALSSEDDMLKKINVLSSDISQVKTIVKDLKVEDDFLKFFKNSKNVSTTIPQLMKKFYPNVKTKLPAGVKTKEELLKRIYEDKLISVSDQAAIVSGTKTYDSVKAPPLPKKPPTIFQRIFSSNVKEEPIEPQSIPESKQEVVETIELPISTPFDPDRAMEESEISLSSNEFESQPPEDRNEIEAIDVTKDEMEQSGDSRLDPGLNTVQINMIMKALRPYGYVGTFPYDLLPKPKNRPMEGYVLNLDDHNNPGSHWISFLLDKKRKTAEIYDSSGLKQTKKVLERILKNVPHGYQLKENSIRSQDYDTNTCGYHAIRFLINRLLLNKTWKQASHYDDIEKNEDQIEFWKEQLGGMIPEFNLI
jgi:hypothetical protein